VLHYASGGKIVSNPQQVGKRRLPRWAKITLIVIGTLAALLLGPRLYIEWRLHSRIAEIRAAGYPLTQEDLDAYYPDPGPRENASDVVWQAYAAIHRDWYDFASFIDTRDVSLPNEAESAQAERVIEGNREALRLLHKAAAMPTCRLRKSVSGERVQKCIELLALEANVAARARNADAIVDSLKAAFGLLKAQRFTASTEELRRRGSNGLRLMADQLRFAGHQRLLRYEDLARFSAALAEEDDPELFVRCLAYERCKRWLTITISPGPRTRTAHLELPRGRQIRIPSWLYQLAGWRTLHRLRVLDLSQARIELFRIPPHMRGSIAAALRKRAQEAAHVVVPQSDLDLLAAVSPWSCREADPDWDPDEPQMYHALVRATMASIAIERYRLATGRIPDSLDQLVPQFLEVVPVYPRNGKPIEYERTAEGYVVHELEIF
jgi:hypothetical protein